MLAMGADPEAVRRFGRWRSDCWRQYAYDTREAMRGVSTKMGTANYTLEHASLDFLAARREVNRQRLQGRPVLQRQEDAKIEAEEALVRARAFSVRRPTVKPRRLGL